MGGRHARLLASSSSLVVVVVVVLVGVATAVPTNAFESHYENKARQAVIPGLSVSGFVDPAQKAYNGDMNSVSTPPSREAVRFPSRSDLVQSHVQIAKTAAVDDTTLSNIPLFPTIIEAPWTAVESWSADGRKEMAAPHNAPFDPDCDSPQLGDVESTPEEREHVDMDHASSMPVPEQSEGSRDALEPDVKSDDEDLHVDDQPEPVDSRGVFSVLPGPDEEEATRNKCSRNTNGHDAPDQLDELGDDCGMPEPLIPCETPGNSTACEPKPRLAAPALPAAELMPPIPPPPFHEPGPEEVSVEFVDFGTSFSKTVPVNTTVADLVEQAGHELGVEADHVLLVRNSGAEVPAGRLVYQLEDRQSLVVYLKCVDRKEVDQLIVPLRICDTPSVERMEVRVEVPNTDEVFTVMAKPSATVQTLLSYTPLPLATISKITYNGMRVQLSHTLNQLRFANKTAFVVYQKPLPPPPVSTPTISSKTELDIAPTPTPYPTPVVTPNPNPNPNPTTTTTASATDDGEQTGSYVPVPETTEWMPRAPMTKPALVRVRVDNHTPLDFPMILEPSDTGLKIFDALFDRIGKPMSQYSVSFHNVRIDQHTPLAGFGFLDNDVVPAHVLP